MIQKQYMDPKTARRMELILPVCGSVDERKQLENSGIDMEKEDPFRVGVSVGSGIGSLTGIRAQRKETVRKGTRQE